jgi:hypothetical protein
MKTDLNQRIISIIVTCFLLIVMIQEAGAAASDSVTISGYIMPHNAPVANFTAFPLSGSVPLTVQFSDLSSGNPTSWSWDFQNDGVFENRTRNPSYTFLSPGIYSVKLHVANEYGSDSEIKTAFITITSSNLDERISKLSRYANGLNIPAWSKWTLTTALRNAANAHDRGNERVAVLHMRMFAENVRLLRWLRFITQSQSDYMISEANAITSIIIR